MNNLAIFDLDGVLVALKDVHFNSLNMALSSFGLDVISRERHLSEFDGMPTREKLRRLGFIEADMKSIIEVKQALTIAAIEETIRPSKDLAMMLHETYASSYLIGVVSNASSNTVLACLQALEIAMLVSFINTPDLGFRSKPSPEMYLDMMRKADSCPKHTVIFEDSPHGLLGAFSSGARVIQVRDVVTSEFVSKSLKSKKETLRFKWPELNVLIPAAGDGRRFSEAGYDRPKPFIKIDGETRMIDAVIENIGVEARFCAIMRREHLLIWQNSPITADIIDIGHKTEGTAVTCLLASDRIDYNAPLLIANSDQILEWDQLAFFYFCQNTNLDGVLAVFKDEQKNPKWSFCEMDGTIIKRVAEKDPISDVANCGVYFWKHGSDFVKYAKKMIEQNIRVNNEFYVAPVFNVAIADGKKFGVFYVDKMHGIGVPEDLLAYQEMQNNFPAVDKNSQITVT